MTFVPNIIILHPASNLSESSGSLDLVSVADESLWYPQDRTLIPLQISSQETLVLYLLSLNVRKLSQHWPKSMSHKGPYGWKAEILPTAQIMPLFDFETTRKILSAQFNNVWRGYMAMAKYNDGWRNLVCRS